MFENETNINYKATGVCYNNIGNYQIKNGKYELAKKYFELAINQARIAKPKNESVVPVKQTEVQENAHHDIETSPA